MLPQEPTKTIYVAVGFKVNEPNSIFYFKEADLIRFSNRLRDAIVTYNPDFVSLRIVKQP